MLNKLYGDGINDDTAAIQELIDTVGSELVLPLAKAFYLISRPLELPSNFRLVLPRFCEIRLAAGSNCVMAKNKEDNAQNIEICGGVWNFNNKAQNPNPILTGVFEPEGYIGFGMAFFGVKGLRLTSMTMKDPVTFAVTLDTVSYFTVDNIVFDFNYGNPLATNMDGIHLNGNCHFGEITNLKGACYDDLVALNADEGTAGEISDITIRGIYSEDCHSAVRLLSANHPVRNVHISDVYGTYFQYCIGITRFYQSLDKGIFDAITLENICKSYGDKRVLQDVSLAVQGITCLMGASGAGKTTLLRILLGLETADGGCITGLPARIAAVFQEDRLVESLTVRKNLQLTLGAQYSEEKALELLREMGVNDTLGSPAGTLSGGMKRRVALVRALLHDAPLLVLDEPFKGLDEKIRAQVMAVVRRHAQERTVLLVTHDREEAQALDARVVQLEEINRV